MRQFLKQQQSSSLTDLLASLSQRPKKVKTIKLMQRQKTKKKNSQMTIRAQGNFKEKCFVGHRDLQFPEEE